MTKAEELITAQDIESVIDIDNADSNFDLKKAIPYLIILIACCLFDTITNLLPVVLWGIYTPVIISGVAIIGYAFSFYKLKPYSKFFGILMFISAINVIFEEINME